MRLLLKIAGILVVTVVAVALLAGGAIGTTEIACRGKPVPQAEPAVLTDPADRRPEARTYLVYPEWYIVYAYEDFGATIAQGRAHEFAFLDSVRGFWTSLCAVRAEADTIGDPGLEAKVTIYTIGVSFTLEMMAKAAYEETLGRIFAATTADSPQDRVEADMAVSYGRFLHQTPWYAFDFEGWIDRLWQVPVENGLRGWERRLAVGAEWKAKAAYARVIANAVGLLGADETLMKVAVTGLDDRDISAALYGTLIEDTERGIILEVDRYRRFTETAVAISKAGGDFIEIAGNDDLLVTLLGPTEIPLMGGAQVLRQERRRGFPEDRWLVSVGTDGLADLVRGLEGTPMRVEHIYDY